MLDELVVDCSNRGLSHSTPENSTEKTMFLRLVALLLLFPIGLFAQTAPADQEWEGSLDVAGTTLTIRVKAQLTDSGWKATLRRVNPDGPEIAADTFQVEGDSVRLEVKTGLTANFVGKLNEAGTEIVGTWKQAGKELPLTFRRVGEERLVEAWKGTLVAGPQTLEFQFRVLETAEGKRLAKFDSLSEKVTGLAAEVTRTAKSVVFAAPGLNARFEGELNAVGDVAEGDWIQGPGRFPMKFERVAGASTVPAEPAPRRPQTPAPPFRYEVEEVTFRNEADDVTLAGTFSRPSDDQPHAAVVLISGSGPQDRDETIFNHKPFLVIADELTKAGIAVLRFDDRGVGKSTGDFAQATSADFANDVRAAVRFLRSHASVNKAQIGLIGHSEGGLIAPMVAAVDPEIAFLILMAGPGVNGFEILKDQGPRLAVAEGMPMEAVDADSKLREAIAGAVRNAPKSADGYEVVEQAVDQYVAGFPESEQAHVRPAPAQVEAFKQLGTPWFRFFLTYEPATSLSQVRCPVLAINGENDLQVWHETNLPAIVNALKAGGNTDFRAVRFPALNHLFQRSRTGAVSEYNQIEQTIAMEVLDLMRNWIKSQTVK